ncbi:MAG TPA: porin family protein [Candidatus Krumholzibacteria bacterium]|nr:porin family protein [Candidatus Krumholzibacteria bacterium]HRX51475.1 porin family protein [Candidatus Krumholzibacteria bacterium]
MALRRLLPLLCCVALLCRLDLAAPAAAQTAADLMASGRVHAAADRHAQALTDFSRAVEADPSVLAQVSRDMAWQALWNDDAPQAVTWFRVWRSLHPDQADDPDMRRGLALALSWANRPGEAAQLYRTLLAEDPADAESRAGLARCLLWDQRLREGFAELRRAEAQDPDAGDFALTVLADYDVPLSARLDASRDSDDLDITRWTVGGAAHLAGGFLLQAEPSWATYHRPGRPDADGRRFRAGLVGGLAPGVTLHLSAWQDRFRGDAPDTYLLGAPTVDWDLTGYDGWLTWQPSPRLRLDAGAGRQAVEAMSPLARRVHLNQRSLSVDRRLSRRWTATAAVGQADYADANRRWSWTGRLQWHREGRVELWAGPAFTLLDFRFPGEGYWSPDRMTNTGLEARARTRGRRWLAEAGVRLGVEKESGADPFSTGGVDARLAWRLHPAALLSLTAGHSRSRVTGSGYSRDFVGLAVRVFP